MRRRGCSRPARESRAAGRGRGRHERPASSHADRVVWQAASLLLGYPAPGLIGRAALIRAALAEAAPHRAADFARRCWTLGPRHAAQTVQTHYVETFDLSRRHTLYLTYWTDGDTRRRGEALMPIQGALPPLAASWSTPMASCRTTCHWSWSTRPVADPVTAPRCCRSTARSLELLRLALVDVGPPYAGVVAAVCATLPGRLTALTGQAVHGDGRRRTADRVRGPGVRTTRGCCRSLDEAGECLMDVLLWGVLPYVMLAVAGRRHDLALPLRPVRLDHPVVPALRVPAAADRLPAVPLRHPGRARRAHHRSGHPRRAGPTPSA